MSAGGSDVAKRIAEALAQDPRTADLPIEVVDQSGMVTLGGEVPSEEIRAVAEEIASRQEGVFQIVNELQVNSEDGGLVVVAQHRSG